MWGCHFFQCLLALNLKVKDKVKAKEHGCERFCEDAHSHPLPLFIKCVRILIHISQNLAHPVRSHSHPGSHPYPCHKQESPFLNPSCQSFQKTVVSVYVSIFYFISFQIFFSLMRIFFLCFLSQSACAFFPFNFFSSYSCFPFSFSFSFSHSFSLSFSSFF